MFWIGFIVGIVIGVIGYSITTVLGAMRITNMSFDEFWGSTELLIEAGNNRESKITLHYDDEDRNVLTFEEK